MMSEQFRATKINEKALLKAVMCHAIKCNDWNRPLTMLSKVNTFQYANKTKDKKGKCIKCSKTFDNFLMLILHLELQHQDQLQINKYQFINDHLTIYVQSSGSQKKQQLLFLKNKRECILIHSFNQRMKTLMNGIFKNFTKKHEPQQRVYFHSNDIFRQIGEGSEEEDSEEDIGHIERQLERMRISDFTDVNENDKLFFINWNDAIHQAKKKQCIIDHSVMMKVLKEFAQKARSLNIQRINLMMHTWTLWSVGKIQSEDVTEILAIYDACQPENVIKPE